MRNNIYRLAERIHLARIKLGISQVELAKKTGINSMAISHYECGRREPNLQNAVKLCNALGCTIGWLVCGDSPE